MEQLFRRIRQLISNKDFDELYRLHFDRPATFNWVKEVFENINVRDHGNASALIWTDGKNMESFTFSEAGKLCNRLLNLVRNRGIEQNDIIFSQMPLLPANWICYLTVIKGGFRFIPAATILSVPDIVYRFNKLMPKVVIADLDNAIKVDEAEKLSGKTIVLKICVDGERKGWVSFSEIHKEIDQAEAAPTKPEDELFLFFTSGTTGMPKVVTHTHFSYALGHTTTAAWIGLHHGDIHYNISQPGWAKYAWSSFFAPWNMGATIFSFNQSGRFNPKEQLQMLENHKITTFCSPPTVLRMLILEDLKSYKLSLRECVAAGEPLNPEIIETWNKGTGIIIRDGYGQTETTCLIANLPDHKMKFGSMGKPTFLYDIIVANDQGTKLSAFEEGSIAVNMNTDKAIGIFSGYFGDPEKNKDVFKHGLYFTGDKAYKDEDDYIWFVGRDDDVIKSSDYRIGPFEVESVLIEHASVVESAVVGSPHPIKGYEIKAFIILAPGFMPEKELANEIFSYSRKILAPYKMPRIIQFVPELPKTINGKIRRTELKALEAENKAKSIIAEYEYFYL